MLDLGKGKTYKLGLDTCNYVSGAHRKDKMRVVENAYVLCVKLRTNFWGYGKRCHVKHQQF